MESSGTEWRRSLPKKVRRVWYWIHDARLDQEDYPYPYVEVHGVFDDDHGEVRCNHRARHLIDRDDKAFLRIRSSFGAARSGVVKLAWPDPESPLIGELNDLMHRVSRRELSPPALTDLVTEIGTIRKILDQLEIYTLEQVMSGTRVGPR